MFLLNNPAEFSVQRIRYRDALFPFQHLICAPSPWIQFRQDSSLSKQVLQANSLESCYKLSRLGQVLRQQVKTFFQVRNCPGHFRHPVGATE